MNIIFSDNNESRRHLLPLSYTRPMACLRIGISTIEEKWKQLLGEDNAYSHLTVPYLSTKYPATIEDINLIISGNILPTPRLAAEVGKLKPGEALMNGNETVAYCGSIEDFESKRYAKQSLTSEEPDTVHAPYDIFLNNPAAIEADFARITCGRRSQPLSPTCTVIGDKSRIFIEEGAVVEAATLNTRGGCIYIGRDAEVMEGACIRGPFAACTGAIIRMGAKIYGGTTLGPYCKVGGEVDNVIMQGYSNKAHDGYLGNAVIGEWCNIGAGTNASNLKNDYSPIRLWDYVEQRFVRTGLQFCGLIMGDHSKTGVNCMINTATVMGVGVNVHGTGFPRPFVQSFYEGSANAGFNCIPLDTFYAIAERVMARRGKELTQADRDIYAAIYNISDRYK